MSGLLKPSAAFWIFIQMGKRERMTILLQLQAGLLGVVVGETLLLFDLFFFFGKPTPALSITADV